jgi:hypothetical protein
MNSDEPLMDPDYCLASYCVTHGVSRGKNSRFQEPLKGSTTHQGSSIERIAGFAALIIVVTQNLETSYGITTGPGRTGQLSKFYDCQW